MSHEGDGTRVSNSNVKKLLKAKLQAQPPSGTRTAFREVEKIYLSRNPPPDYTDVLDISCSQGNHRLHRHELSHSAQRLFRDPSAERDQALAVYTLHDHPGLLLIPGVLSPARQRTLIKKCMREFVKDPNPNSLDTHYRLPRDGLWYHYERQKRFGSPDFDVQPLFGEQQVSSIIAANSRTLIEHAPMSADVPIEVLTSKKDPPPPGTTLKPVPLSQIIYKLRWSNLGLMYHWTSKSYHYEEVFEKGLDAMTPVPPIISQLSTSLLEAIPIELIPEQEDWSNFRPQSGIINFYQLKDTLMGHVDQSELVEDKPLVSLSLGHTAIFLIGGKTRDVKPTALYLRSGDALIMSGSCRRAFHGVPRIVKGSLPVYLDGIDFWSQEDRDRASAEELAEWEPFAQYMQTTRINLNIRQVFPQDFSPSIEPAK